MNKNKQRVETYLHVLELGCDGVFEWGKSGVEGIFLISLPLPGKLAPLR